MTEQLGFACGPLTDVVTTHQAWEGSRGNPLGRVSLGGDPRSLETIKVVAPSRPSPERKSPMKARSFVLFDDASPTPKTRWKHFCGAQEALNKYLMNE